MLYFCRRGRQNLRQFKKSDFVVGTDSHCTLHQSHSQDDRWGTTDTATLSLLLLRLIALYFLAPSAVSCLPFFSALCSSHRSSMLVVTYGLLTALRLPKISLAVSVITLLKEFTSVSTSVSCCIEQGKWCKFTTNHCLEDICNLRVFELFKIELNPCGALYFYLP